MSTVLSLHGDGDMNKVPTSKRERGEGFIGKVEDGKKKVQGQTFVFLPNATYERSKTINDRMEELRPQHPDLDEMELLKLAIDEESEELRKFHREQSEKFDALMCQLGLSDNRPHLMAMMDTTSGRKKSSTR